MRVKNGLENPWELILSRPYLSEMALEFRDPRKRLVWSQALFEGGNTIRLWNEAVELKMAFLTACSLKEGQRVALLGKFCEECGLSQVIQSLVGREGKLSTEEILPNALTSIRNPSFTKQRFQWDFSNLDSLPDQSLDHQLVHICL